MSKPVLMIHDFKREYLDLPLEDYVITFDDGLVSPLDYWDDINSIPTEKIFFVPTSVIYTGMEGRHPTDFFELDEILFLDKHDDVTIGGHSHYHERITEWEDFIEAVNFMHEDTEKMCNWFEGNLGYKPTHFCYPYNEMTEIYQSILRVQFGLQHFYGAERKDIEELL